MIVRVRPTGTDVYGDREAGDPDRLTIDSAFVAPRHSNEVHDPGREAVVTGLTLFAPVGSDIVHTDQVEVDGVLYDIDGDPGTWEHPWTSWAAGMTAELTQATG
jgi:hypothetical protein